MNNDEINLGARIKYFRKRSGLKQMDLELRAGLPNGTISRIERNKVNPSKETIRKISEVLQLNHKELDYLIGITRTPASQIEIAKAYEDIENYFQKRGVLAYLVDERGRFLEFSQTLIKLSGFNERQVNKIKGNTIIKILLDDSLGVKSLIHPDYYEKLLRSQITHYYVAISYMQDDYYFQESMELIKNDPLASKIFREIQKEANLKLLTLSFKTVTFRFLNKFSITLNYYREPLLAHPRFYITEYIPNNKLLQLISKLTL